MLTTTVSGRTWHFSHPIGLQAGRGRGFYFPTVVAIAPGGVLYVLNTGDPFYPNAAAHVSKLTMDEEYIGDFGLDDFVWPGGMALDRDGNVYCSEDYENFIVVYSSDGERLGQWGNVGSEEGQFRGPVGLAFDGEDNLWVADSLNDRVQRFTKEGQFLQSWGSTGSDDGQLNRPWGITVDQNDDVYVADWGNDRVQKYSPDGTFLLSFGSLIPDGGELNHPSDVAVDSDGDVYVTDWGNNRVQIYYPDGEIITGLYGDAQQFSKWGQEHLDANPDYVRAIQRVDPTELVRLGHFGRPRGIAIDNEDRIVITDSIRCRLQVYTKDNNYLPPQFNL